METDNSICNGKFFSSDSISKCTTNGNPPADDFLSEFFPELKVPAVHTMNKKEMQHGETVTNGHGSLLMDDLSLQNEKLKQLNKELKEKSILQESQIAKYEADLSEKMQAVFNMNQEYEEIKEKYQKIEKVKAEMEQDMTQLKAQVAQLAEIRDKSTQDSNQIVELQRDISSKEKAQRKIKNELEAANKNLTEKNGFVRKMKSSNKKLWNIIMDVSNILSKNGLLSVKKKEQILKEIDDQMCLTDFVADGGNIKEFLCNLNASAARRASSPPAKPSEYVESPQKTSQESLAEPSEGFFNSAASTATSDIERQSALVTENCVTSNVKPYSSNFLLKTHKDVIEDLVSEDYNELNSFRQQLSVLHDPISPLPPTPPPKNNSKLLEEHNLSSSKKSSVFAGKRLNFFHQQSESFETQNVEKPPNLSNRLPTPPLNSSQYVISSKLHHDGSLKLDFCANYDTHLCFDMNTRKVSCTVMPKTSPECPSVTPTVPPSPSACHNSKPISPSYAVVTSDPKRIKLDTGNKKLQKPIVTSPEHSEKKNPKVAHFTTQEKKTLNDIGRSGKVYSAFVSPSEKRVSIPSVRVSPRQLAPSHAETSMEIEPVESQVSAAEDAPPKKHIRRSRKIKNSDDLFQSLKNKSKAKKETPTKRKTSELENVEFEEKNECSDSNNEDESKKSQLSSSPQNFSSVTVNSSPSHSNNNKKAKNQKSPLSDHLFKVPCTIMNEISSVPKCANELSEPSSVELNNDIDFSDIQVSPFNPSTFVPRGLFTNELIENQKSDKVEAVLPADNFASCPMSPPPEPSDLNDNLSAANSCLDVHPVLSAPNYSDGLDSDHSLVIAEDIEQSSVPVSAAESGDPSSPLRSEGEVPGKRKNKKGGAKQKVNNGSKRKKKEVPAAVVDVVTISAAFNALEEIQFNEKHFKQNLHTLVNALINPSNANGPQEVSYHILEYLLRSRCNPLIGYFMNEKEDLLMPLKEKCIVEALLQIAKKRKSHLYGLLESVTNTAYELILTKESAQIYGLSALCRVLTEICRCKRDKRSPLMLCSELLKKQHKFSPYLIASVAGVWKDLFSSKNATDEELDFYSCIVYGMQRKPNTLNEQQWKHCSKVISAFLPAIPHLSKDVINERVSNLIPKIEENALNKGSEEGEEGGDFILTTPLIVFTAVLGWSWAQTYLVDKHIIPMLVKFAEQEKSKEAFTVFCHLYAEICYFCPDKDIESPREVFMEFSSDKEGNDDWVRDASFIGHLKLLLCKKLPLPSEMSAWVAEVQYRTDYAQYLRKIFLRRMMGDEEQFLSTEVQ